MKDSDHLQREIEKAEKERHRVRHYESGECDLCPDYSDHLIDGICPKCHGRFKIKEIP